MLSHQAGLMSLIKGAVTPKELLIKHDQMYEKKTNCVCPA